jgi:ribonuclease D
LFISPDGRQFLREKPPLSLRVLKTARQERKFARRKAGEALPSDRALFEKLRARRLELAKAQNVPPYVIFHDRTLSEIAARRPQSVAELGAIHGVGEAKLARYGEAFLEVIKGHDTRPGEDLRPGEALRPSALPPSAHEEHVRTIQQQHPSAYEKWTQEDDTELLSLHAAGTSLSQLATHFQRQPSAIRSRLARLLPESNFETR